MGMWSQRIDILPWSSLLTACGLPGAAVTGARYNGQTLSACGEASGERMLSSPRVVGNRVRSWPRLLWVKPNIATVNIVSTQERQVKIPFPKKGKKSGLLPQSGTVDSGVVRDPPSRISFFFRNSHAPYSSHPSDPSDSPPGRRTPRRRARLRRRTRRRRRGRRPPPHRRQQ